MGNIQMSDRALDNAVRRRDEVAASINALSQQVDELRRELRRIDDFVSQWHEFAGDQAGTGTAGVPTAPSVRHAPIPPRPPTRDIPLPTSSVAPVLPEPAPDAPRTRSTVKNPDRREVAEAAWNIMQELGRPVPRSELYEKLKSNGVEIFGKDPEMVLSTMMWRMQDWFVRIPKHGYWRKDRPCPTVGYTPGEPISDDDEEGQEIVRHAILNPEDMADD